MWHRYKWSYSKKANSYREKSWILTFGSSPSDESKTYSYSVHGKSKAFQDAFLDSGDSGRFLETLWWIQGTGDGELKMGLLGSGWYPNVYIYDAMYT